jgi:hypothetical protein
MTKKRKKPDAVNVRDVPVYKGQSDQIEQIFAHWRMFSLGSFF